MTKTMKKIAAISAAAILAGGFTFANTSIDLDLPAVHVSYESESNRQPSDLRGPDTKGFDNRQANVPERKRPVGDKEVKGRSVEKNDFRTAANYSQEEVKDSRPNNLDEKKSGFPKDTAKVKFMDNRQDNDRKEVPEFRGNMKNNDRQKQLPAKKDNNFKAE